MLLQDSVCIFKTYMLDTTRRITEQYSYSLLLITVSLYPSPKALYSVFNHEKMFMS